MIQPTAQDCAQHAFHRVHARRRRLTTFINCRDFSCSSNASISSLQSIFSVRRQCGAESKENQRFSLQPVFHPFQKFLSRFFILLLAAENHLGNLSGQPRSKNRPTPPYLISPTIPLDSQLEAPAVSLFSVAFFQSARSQRSPPVKIIPRGQYSLFPDFINS